MADLTANEARRHATFATPHSLYQDVLRQLADTLDRLADEQAHADRLAAVIRRLAPWNEQERDALAAHDARRGQQ